MPESIEPTGEDAIFGQITFANGTLGQWANHHAGHGEAVHQRPRLRHARLDHRRPATATATRSSSTWTTATRRSPTSTFSTTRRATASSPCAASLFGGERIWRYNFDFPTTDRKLLALEYHELASCVRSGSSRK